MINAKKNMMKAALSVMMAALVTIAFSAPAFAAVPDKEKVEYKGKGKVEVEFAQDVKYKKSKVKVTDKSGKTYKVKVLERDDDEITFKIKKYKTGKKYNVKITGVKAEGTKKYGTFKCTVKIPKASKSITKDKAKSIALKDAVNDYGITKSTVRDFEIESDTYKGTKVWEISFEAKKNGKYYDYEYEINKKSGKIMYSEEELD